MAELNFNKIANINPVTGLKDPVQEHECLLEQVELAKDGLKKIKTARQKTKEIYESSEIARKKVDYGKNLYSAYDDIAFEGKTRIDMIYFDQLLQKLEESEDINIVLSNLYKTVKEIYEFVNIEPQVYGRGVDYNFLDESVSDQQRKLSEIIYEHINNKFYKLSPEKRKEVYIDECKEYAKQLIEEGIDADAAIQHSIKTIVMEGLVRRITFPQQVWYRINYLMEDEDYGKVFDQPELINLVEDYNTKIYNLAKIVAAVI